MASRRSFLSAGALAPFGRIGRRLGWRWIFPVGTLPIPFHPLLARLLPFALLAWIGWLALGPGPVAWAAPLVAALLLAIPLSIPFVQWGCFAFRIHLLQAVMLPAAMLLLGIAAWRGEMPAAAGLAAILFFAGHLLAAAAGRWIARRIERRARAVDEYKATDARDRPPLLLEKAGNLAEPIMDRLGLASLHVAADGGCRQLVRTSDAEIAPWAARIGALGKRGLTLSGRPGDAVRHLRLPAEALPPGIARIRDGRLGGLAGRLVGRVAGIRIENEGAPAAIYHHGRVAPLSWLPGFIFFMQLRLGAVAHWSPTVGFLRARPRDVGKAGDRIEAIAAAVAALARGDGESGDPIDAAALGRRIDATFEAMLQQEMDALDRLLSAPAEYRGPRFEALEAEPKWLASRGGALCEAFRKARAARAYEALGRIAQLIARLPEADFGAAGDEILALLNSAEVADAKPIRVHLSGGKAPGAAKKPPFAGFGLIGRVPELYVRLAELGPRARPLVMAMGERFGWPAPLVTARDSLDRPAPATDGPEAG